jgi:hypothetical protein
LPGEDSVVMEEEYYVLNLSGNRLMHFKQVKMSHKSSYLQCKILAGGKQFALFGNTTFDEIMTDFLYFKIIENNTLVHQHLLNFFITRSCELPLYKESVIHYLSNKGVPMKVPEIKVFPKNNVMEHLKMKDNGKLWYNDTLIGHVQVGFGCHYSGILNVFIFFNKEGYPIARAEYFGDTYQDGTIVTIEDKRKYYITNDRVESHFVRNVTAILKEFKYLE